MSEKYTADDFANARFAEHPDGNYALRKQFNGPKTWIRAAGGFGMTDEELAKYGWVPVPTKPTITQSRFDGEFDTQWRWNVVEIQQKLEKLGIEIIPDPEPTNTDRLEELIINAPGNFEGVKAILKRPANVRAWAEYLNKHGVTAPNVKGN